MSSTIATTIVLVVSPSLKPDGGKAHSTRGQLFDGRVGAQSIVKRSATPFCAAARALLAEGIDPTTKLVMRRDGSSHDGLRSTLGVAAKLTVADGTGKPIFLPWVDLRQTWLFPASIGPHGRETGEPAVQDPTPQSVSRSRPHEDLRW
jgi:hypothetical protein